MSTPSPYKFLLEDGREIAAGGSEEEAAHSLERHGIVTLRKIERIHCYHDDDDDYLLHPNPGCQNIFEIQAPSDSVSDDELACERCGYVIKLEEKRRHSFLALTIENKGVREYVGQRISSCFSVSFVFDKQALGKLDARPGGINLCIYEQTSDEHRSAGLSFLEPYVFILADARSESAFQLVTHGAAIRLWEMLTLDDEHLKQAICEAAMRLVSSSRYQPLSQMFDQMEKRGWTYFEKNFLPTLLRHLSENPELVSHYLSSLKRVAGTLFGCLVLPTGGPGKTDVRLLPKYELLHVALQARTIFDAKNYTKKSLSRTEVERVRSHLDDDITEPAHAVIAVSSDEIESTAWEAVINYNRRFPSGECSIVILPRTMLLEIIFHCKAESILDLTGVPSDESPSIEGCLP